MRTYGFGKKKSPVNPAVRNLGIDSLKRTALTIVLPREEGGAVRKGADRGFVSREPSIAPGDRIPASAGGGEVL